MNQPLANRRGDQEEVVNQQIFIQLGVIDLMGRVDSLGVESFCWLQPRGCHLILLKVPNNLFHTQLYRNSKEQQHHAGFPETKFGTKYYHYDLSALFQTERHID